MSYDGEPGTDFFGYPPHPAHGCLDKDGVKIWNVIQNELVTQGKAAVRSLNDRGKGYVLFRQDIPGYIVLDCQVNLYTIVERIQKALKGEDE